MRVLQLTVLLLLPALAACSSGERLTAPPEAEALLAAPVRTPAFSIAPPKTFQPLDHRVMAKALDLDVLASFQSPEHLTTSVMVGSLREPGRGTPRTTLEDLQGSLLERLRGAPGIVVHRADEVDAGGQEALLLEYELGVPELFVQRSLQLWVFGDEKTYTVTCASSRDGWSTVEPTFRAVLASFALRD